MRMQFDANVLARAFGIHSDKTILGFKRRTPKNPLARFADIDGSHTFDPNQFEAMRLWWEWEDTRCPLYISGPTGCGKTTTVLQFLSRLNAPAVTLTCRKRMDKYELIGNYGVGDGSTAFRWFDGPASIAWRYGYVLVINEFTTAPPEVWVSSNDILEGDDLVNERTGERIPKHPNTRVIITDNCRAAADDSGTYLSRHTQDASVADRFWHLEMGFLNPDAEMRMLTRKLQESHCALPSEVLTPIIQAGIKLAEDSRKKCAEGFGYAISTRVLIRFLTIYCSMRAGVYTSKDDVLDRSLKLAYADGLPKRDTELLLELARFEFAKIG